MIEYSTKISCVLSPLLFVAEEHATMVELAPFEEADEQLRKKRMLWGTPIVPSRRIEEKNKCAGLLSYRPAPGVVLTVSG